MKANWNRKLTKALYTRDGQVIKTLADARKFAVELPANYSSRNHRQKAAELMIAAVEGGSTWDASRQIQTALFLDMRLDVTKTPP